MIRFIPRRYWAVIAVALALTMSVLDGTIVNVALPTLSREFGTSPSSTIWIVNAYQLTITMSLLSFSALGDIYGYKRIFLIGTTIFCSTSLFCALSSSFAMLTVARILQGILGYHERDDRFTSYYLSSTIYRAGNEYQCHGRGGIDCCRAVVGGRYLISRFLELVVRYQRTFRDLRDYNGLFSFASKSLQGWAETKV